MAKISGLPPLDAGDVNGTEMVLVLKNGQTWGCAIADAIGPAAQPFVDAAALSAGFAEAFSGPVHASVAAGEAAIQSGLVFRVDNGDGTLSPHLRTSDGSIPLEPLATTGHLGSAQGAGSVGVKRPEANAVKQTTFDILTRVIRPSPLSFNGKGDGATDDTGPILDCIEKTGRLFLPKGTWLCDSEVLTTALEAVGNVTLVGEGQDSILAFTDGGLNLRGRAFRYGTLRDIHLRALGSDQILLNLIALNDNDWPVRWVIDNIRCSSSSLPSANNTGIAIGGGWIGSIINPIVQGLGKGIHIYPTALASPAVAFNGLNIVGGEIQGNVTGVDMASPLNVNFFGTAIEGNRGSGALIRSGSRSVSFYGCYFETNGIDTPASSNDIRLEVSGALDTLYSVLVDSGCTFLRGDTGAPTAIWANKCQELLVEEGAVFNGYTNRLEINEIAATTVTGAFRARSSGANIPVVNNSNSFGDPKSLVSQIGSPAMPDAATTTSGEIYLVLSSQAAKLGSITINFTADAAGAVIFRVEPFDVATGVALATFNVNVAAVVGRNIATSIFNFDSRSMRGKTTAVRVARLGASDVNAGSTTLSSIELRWNA
ncbi:hypothetical protein GCM10011494_07790 [Novosphingobium endophyticum]|uniref:Pectate lyase superfamily protein domain-containing protein n=1 Tax=Novosphingobium endophyticum TaxID=1955250 RepID=A0A916TRF2_9SPHN|nr:hypothetical protein [Novosphingobium endophyticum]GGB91866.1 hypothetical protein GCM10011494_07790 [Novosphingobium endophyticum]